MQSNLMQSNNMQSDQVFSGIHPERLKNIQSDKLHNKNKNTYTKSYITRGKSNTTSNTTKKKVNKMDKKSERISNKDNTCSVNDLSDSSDSITVGITVGNTVGNTVVKPKVYGKVNSDKSKIKVNNMVLTIDVGLKNLAMCIMDSEYNIHLWDVYNLLDDEQYSYSCEIRQKDGKMCEKKCQFKIPKELKKKVNTLDINTSDNTNGEHDGSDSKAAEQMFMYYCKRHYPKDIPNQKKYFIKDKKVGDFLLQDIAERIMKGINDIYNKHLDLFNSVTNVCIELQPKVNQRMKFTSHIIYAKFVDLYKDRNGAIPVRFIRASQNLQAYRGPPVECKLKTPYSRRKYLSVAYTKWYLEHDLLCNEFNKSRNYSEFLLSHPKKDDLCDVSNANINVHKGLKKKQKINKNGSEIK
jgi:hypothetical protein